MKEHDFLETWEDFVGIFGPRVAPKLTPIGGKLWAILRLPSRTRLVWKRVRRTRAKSDLVKLDDESNTFARSGG